MIKVLFITINLGGGGAERVLVNLVNHLDKNKYDITVETMFSGGVNVQNLADHITYICRKAPCPKGIAKIFRFIPSSILFHFFINENDYDYDYDIIIAFMHGIPVKIVAGCKSEKTKKIAWLHNGDPQHGSFFIPWFSEKKAFRAYDSMDKLVGVSESVSRAFSEYTGISRDKVITKYNTNDTEKIIQLGREPYSFDFDNNDIVVCSVGGLALIKGYDRLINVSVKLHNEGYRFNLVIVGKGPEKNKLQQQISVLQASEYIKLLGFQENPYNIMKNSDVFISSSRQEGMATVLLEAMTLGLPVISTDVSGAKEVLGENNEFGIVVDNSEDGIYNGLKTMLCNNSMRKKYSEVSTIGSKRFNTESTINEVDKLFSSLINE